MVESNRYCSGLIITPIGTTSLCPKHTTCYRWLEFQKIETTDRILSTMLHADDCISKKYINNNNPHRGTPPNYTLFVFVLI